VTIAALPQQGEETGLRISTVAIAFDHIAMSTIYFRWAWPSRQGSQQPPVPFRHKYKCAWGKSPYTAVKAGSDAAGCDLRCRCAAITGSTIAPQLMQRHPAYSWSPNPRPPRSSNCSQTINPSHLAHLIILPPSLTTPCRFPPFPQGLRLEVASA